MRVERLVVGWVKGGVGRIRAEVEILLLTEGVRIIGGRRRVGWRVDGEGDVDG